VPYLLNFYLLKAQPPKLVDTTNLPIFNKCERINAVAGFNFWKCDSLNCGELFTTFKNYTGLGYHDSMIIHQVCQDSITFILHTKYQQFHKGLPLEYTYYVEHSFANKVLFSNGFIAENFNKNSNPSVTEFTALANALNYLNAYKYAWNDSLEYFLKNDSLAGDTTYYPKGELIWALMGNRQVEDSNYSLAWKFNITYFLNDSVFESKNVYIDANTGQVIKVKSSGFKTGTFNHVLYGSLTLDHRYWGGIPSKFFLQANDNVRDIRTKRHNFGTWNVFSLARNSTSSWGNNEWVSTASHWAVMQAWDYWKNIWSRNGTNGNGIMMKVQANYAYNNAEYDDADNSSESDYIKIGMFNLGLGATPDIAGHEYAHGVTLYTANLIYEGEQGALNESFSDIFGILTERNTFPSTWDWTIGEDCSNETVRDISKPKNRTSFDPNNCLPPTYPEYYLETNAWLNTTSNCDLGGVHHNSAVQNRCFYLLANGGTQLGIIVSGIGIQKASMIVEHALTNGFVLSTTDYTQNREAWIEAAIDLFGICSIEQFETCKAWAACNIGTTCFCDDVMDPCLQEKFRYPWMIPEIAPMGVDIENIVINFVKIYPNPSNDIITINFSELESQIIEQINSFVIVDMIGKEVHTQERNHSSNTNTIDISNLKQGVYTLKIILNGNAVAMRIVKI